MIQFFDRNIIRIEIVDSKLLLTGLQFFRIRTKEINKDDITYKITLEIGFRSRCQYLRIYEKGIEKYSINDKDLNEEEFGQVISYFRVYLPPSAKLK